VLLDNCVAGHPWCLAELLPSPMFNKLKIESFGERVLFFENKYIMSHSLITPLVTIQLTNFFRQTLEFDGYSRYRTYPICHLRRSKKNPKKMYLKMLDGYGKSMTTYVMYLRNKDNASTSSDSSDASVSSEPNELKYFGKAVNHEWVTMELRIIQNNYLNPKVGMCELELRLQPWVDELPLLASVLYVPNFKP